MVVDLTNRYKVNEEKGIEIIPVTLHVGLGTFRPVMEEDILKHKK